MLVNGLVGDDQRTRWRTLDQRLVCAEERRGCRRCCRNEAPKHSPNQFAGAPPRFTSLLPACINTSTHDLDSARLVKSKSWLQIARSPSDENPSVWSSLSREERSLPPQLHPHSSYQLQDLSHWRISHLAFLTTNRSSSHHPIARRLSHIYPRAKTAAARNLPPCRRSFVADCSSSSPVVHILSRDVHWRSKPPPATKAATTCTKDTSTSTPYPPALGKGASRTPYTRLGIGGYGRDDPSTTRAPHPQASSMASTTFRDSMQSLGWSRRDPDLPVSTSSTPPPLLSRLQALSPFGDGGYVRLPTHEEGPGAPLPAPSRREEEEGFFACKSRRALCI